VVRMLGRSCGTEIGGDGRRMRREKGRSGRQRDSHRADGG
jgi:hypothetical protein